MSTVEPAFAPAAGEAVLRFRGYELLPGERLLLRHGRPVELGGRAFDLLFVLLRSRGTLVEKNTIIGHVWPTTIVGESSLRFQMACLRRALGPDGDVIKTVSGRGYLFAEERGGRRAGLQAEAAGPVAAAPRGTIPDDGRRDALARARRDVVQPVMAVIDDGPDMGEALEALLRSVGLWREDLPCGEAGSAARTRCPAPDARMSGCGGLAPQAGAAKAGRSLPVILIGGHADAPSVRAMRLGALEFLTRSGRHQDLLAAIRTALSLPAVPAPAE